MQDTLYSVGMDYLRLINNQQSTSLHHKLFSLSRVGYFIRNYYLANTQSIFLRTRTCSDWNHLKRKKRCNYKLMHFDEILQAEEDIYLHVPFFQPCRVFCQNYFEAIKRDTRLNFKLNSNKFLLIRTNFRFTSFSYV